MPDEVKPLLPDITVTTDVDDVINHPEVDLIVIAVPNAWHFEFAQKALQAGKHVVVEKPLTVTAAETDELIALTKQKGVILTQFHNRRWDGGFLTAKKLIKNGTLGDVAIYEANYDRWVPTVSDNWREQNKPGNGALYDLGIHMIDQAFALFGRPHAIQATIKNTRPNAQTDDYFDIQFFYPNIQVNLRATMLGADPAPRYKVIGTKGTYIKHMAEYGSDPQAGMLTQGMRPGDTGWALDEPKNYGYIADGDTKTPVPTVQGAYETFYTHLADAILSGKPQPIPTEETRDIIAAIEACFASNAQGKRLSAKEIGFLQPPKE
jgi:scyllo-inositol 2-dehydrogenase (NADP+)